MMHEGIYPYFLHLSSSFGLSMKHRGGIIVKWWYIPTFAYHTWMSTWSYTMDARGWNVEHVHDWILVSLNVSFEAACIHV